MDRRGFLKSILVAGVAPYVVTTAGVLMPVRALRESPLILWGDGIHDDTVALQAASDGKHVIGAYVREGVLHLGQGIYRMTGKIVLPENVYGLNANYSVFQSEHDGPILEVPFPRREFSVAGVALYKLRFNTRDGWPFPR